MSSVSDKELFTTFFILGRGSEDWEFLEDNWADDYQEATQLTWEQFLLVEAKGWDAQHQSLIEVFERSLLSIKKSKYLKKIFPEISTDPENWNDFFDMLIDAPEFDDVWENSWLTRDEMENSLEDYIDENEDSDEGIENFKSEFRGWFESEAKAQFRKDVITLLAPLADEITRARNS